MFEQLIESSATKRKKGRSAFFVATAVVWLTAMSSTIIVGVLAFDGRLNDDLRQLIRLGPVVTLPPPKGDSTTSTASGATKPQAGLTSAPESPLSIPDPSIGPPDIRGGIEQGIRGVPDGVEDLSGAIVPGALLGGGEAIDPPPPPPAPPPKREEPPPAQRVVRISTGPLQGSALRRVEPVYPPLAKQIRLSGAVVIEVVISEQGEVISVRAVSGHPLLRDAAIKAAWGWKWKPTTLNKVPVRVVGTITFNFVL